MEIKNKNNELKETTIKTKDYSLYEKMENKFLQHCFYDTSLLFKLLYHKYFLNEIYEEIKNTNLRSLTNIEKSNSLKAKMINSLIFPSKILCEKNLKISEFSYNEELNEKEIKEFEKEKISKEFLADYIKICKFNWSNSLTSSCYLIGVGFLCLCFKIHKRPMTFNHLIIISIQIFLFGMSFYHIYNTHPHEAKLKDYYSDELQKYKLIFKE